MAKKTKAEEAAVETEEEEEEEEDSANSGGGSLFDKPRSSREGDFWPAALGVYIGELVGFEKGPEFTNTDKDGNESKRFTVQWSWELSKLSGKPLFYTPEDGENKGTKQRAIGEALTSTIVSQKSSAGKWFSAHLQRDINFDSEEESDLREESMGKSVLITFSKNESGNVSVNGGGVSELPDEEDEEE